MSIIKIGPSRWGKFAPEYIAHETGIETVSADGAVYRINMTPALDWAVVGPDGLAHTARTMGGGLRWVATQSGEK